MSSVQAVKQILDFGAQEAASYSRPLFFIQK
jgi:hypothetical protein